MTTRSLIIACSTALALFTGCNVPLSATEALRTGQDKAQIIILYDAFGKDPAMQKDWGYAAFIEYGGKRILFDSGNNPDSWVSASLTKTLQVVVCLWPSLRSGELSGDG